MFNKSKYYSVEQVLILICVEVSVWAYFIYTMYEYANGVLILICVEVSVWDSVVESFDSKKFES